MDSVWQRMGRADAFERLGWSVHPAGFTEALSILSVMPLLVWL